MAKLDTNIKFNMSSWPYIHSSMVPNSTPMFYGTDSEQLYNRNLKYAPQDWIYRDKKVEYTFNNYGLRMPENITTEGKSIYFSGTSHTMGIGVSEQDRFSDIVSKETKLDYINYAGPTYSIKLQILSFFNFLKTYDAPKVLVIEYAPSSGYTFFNNSQAIVYYSKHLSNTEYNNSYKELKETAFFENEAKIYQSMLQVLCKKNNIKLIELTLHPDDPFAFNNMFSYDLNNDIKTNNISLKYGRDVVKRDGEYSGHPGIQAHRDIAEHILKEL
jgi:hypothetical protein